MKRGYRGQHKGSTVKARSKNAARALINSILAVVLVFGLAPGLSFAADALSKDEPLEANDIPADVVAGSGERAGESDSSVVEDASIDADSSNQAGAGDASEVAAEPEAHDEQASENAGDSDESGSMGKTTDASSAIQPASSIAQDEPVAVGEDTTDAEGGASEADVAVEQGEESGEAEDADVAASYVAEPTVSGAELVNGVYTSASGPVAVEFIVTLPEDASKALSSASAVVKSYGVNAKKTWVDASTKKQVRVTLTFAKEGTYNGIAKVYPKGYPDDFQVFDKRIVVGDEKLDVRYAFDGSAFDQIIKFTPGLDTVYATVAGDDKLVLNVRATKVDATHNAKLTLSWFNLDGSLAEKKPKVFEKSFANVESSAYNVDFELNPNDFVGSDGSLYKAKAALEVWGEGDNVATTYDFSGAMKTGSVDDYNVVTHTYASFVAVNAKLCDRMLSVKPGDNVESYVEDGITHYNGTVNLILEDPSGLLARDIASAISAKVAVDGETETTLDTSGASWEGSTLTIPVAQDEAACKNYTVKVAATAKDTSTFEFADRSFVIDTTAPTVSYEFDGETVKQENVQIGDTTADRYVFKKDVKHPAVKVTVQNLSALAAPTESVAISLNGAIVSAEGALAWDTETGTDQWVGTLSNVALDEEAQQMLFGECEDNVVSAVVTDKFGVSTAAAVSDDFMVDTTDPHVALAFNAPATAKQLADEVGTLVRAMFGDFDGENVGKVGQVAITFIDPTFDEGKTEVQVFKDGATSPTATITSTSAAVEKTTQGDNPVWTISYAHTNLGDGDWKLTVVAKDLAENETRYQYAGVDAEGNNKTSVTNVAPSENGKLDDTFTIDTEPVAFTTPSEDKWAEITFNKTAVKTNKVIGEATDVHVFADSVTATINLTDANFDPNSSDIAITTLEGTTISDGIKDNKWNNGEGEKAWAQPDADTAPENWSASYTFDSADGAYVIALKANDYAQNKALEETWVIDVDAVKPNVDVTFDQQCKNSDKATQKDYFDAAVTATVTVTDRNFDSSSNPADCITVLGTEPYEVADATVNESSWTPSSDKPGVYTATITFGKDSSLGKSYRFTVNAKDAVSPGHDVSYRYGDNTASGEGAGQGGICTTKDVKGTALEGLSFVIDTTAPKLSVSYNATITHSSDGKFYFAKKDGNSVSATIKVIDNNFNPKALIVDAGSATVSVWAGEGNTHTCTVTYANDGEYTLAVSGKDWAQNPTELYDDGDESENKTTNFTDQKDTSKFKRAFIVDTTAPELTVSYNATITHSSDDKFYFAKKDGNSVSVTVKIEEKNFDANTISIESGTAIRSAWSDEGDSHTMLLTYPDGEYETTLIVTGKDRAQNPTKLVDGNDQSENKTTNFADQEDASKFARTFRVDTVAPKLTVAYSPVVEVVEGDPETRYYNQDAAVTVKAEDAYLADSSLTEGIQVKIGGNTLQLTSANGYENSMTLGTAEGDAVYDLSIAGADRAGNYLVAADDDVTKKAFDEKAHTYNSRVVIDTTSPKIHVAWSPDAATNGKYFNTNRTAEITIDERYIDLSKVAIGVNGASPKATNPDDWKTTGTEHTYKVVTFTDNTNNDQYLVVTGADRAGNPLEAASNGADDAKPTPAQAPTVTNGTYTSANFIIDRTSPQIAITTNQNRASKFKNVDYYKARTNLVMSIAVTDDNFNPQVDERKGTIAVSGKQPTAAYNASNWSGSNYRVTFEEHGIDEPTSTMRVTVFDLAGNRTVYSYGQPSDQAEYTSEKTGGLKCSTMAGTEQLVDNTKFSLDCTAPQLVPRTGNDIPTNDPSNDYEGQYKGRYLFYDKQTSMRINVTDAIGVNDVTQIGDDQTYTFSIDDGSDKGDTTRPVTIRLQDGKEFTKDFVIRAVDNAGNWRQWSINPRTGEVNDTNDSSNVNTPLYGDKTKLYPLAAIQDTVAPVLAWSGVSAGEYYNTPQTARLTVNELNFRYLANYDGAQTVITNDKQAGNAGRAASQTTVAVSSFDASDARAGSYYYDLPFSDDGHYTLTANLTDPAGNKAAQQRMEEFTIDRTPPTIEVTWDNNSARNGMYYDRSRTATIVITEHNFEASDFTVDTTGSVGGWSTDGDTHTCIVSYATDGRYTLTVTGHDKAGNELAPYNEPEFVIDMTAPRITFADVADHEAYNETIAPQVIYVDEANLDANALNWTLTGNKNGAKSFAASQSVAGDTGTVAFANFPEEVESDDIYTLDAQMSDLAGNQAENSITFSVNRFGSNFIVQDKRDFEDNDGYLAEAREVVIQEINVDGSETEDHEVVVTHGLTTDNLKIQSRNDSSAEGYYIDSGAESYGWASYYYHIGSGNFSEDGNYHVVVQSKDKATNENNSASYYNPDEHEVADAEVSFILDTADPIIDGLNVASGGTYNADNFAITFNANDNIGFKDAKVKVRVDGVEKDVEPELGGECRVPVDGDFLKPESFKGRNLEITATDMAGRTAHEEVSDFHLTTNFVELNLPFVIGGGVVVVGGIAAAAVWFVRRRGGMGHRG